MGQSDVNRTARDYSTYDDNESTILRWISARFPASAGRITLKSFKSLRCLLVKDLNDSKRLRCLKQS